MSDTIRDDVRRALRDDRELTFKAIGEACGMDYSVVHAYLSGKRDLRVENLERMLAGFNLRLAVVPRTRKR